MTVTLSPRMMALIEAMTRLGDRAPATARDILAKAARYGDVTDRQHSYVVDLIGKAGAQMPREHARIDLTRVTKMFEAASAQLKRPFVLFATYKPDPANPLKQVVDVEFRASLAPATGKNPGAIYIKARGEYAGKIMPDGSFVPVRGAPDGLLGALEDFASDPARAALAYGQATSSCCFCNLTLEDPVSVEVGYGPICAKRWGLPHRHTGLGKFVAEEVSDPYLDELAFVDASGFEVR